MCQGIKNQCKFEWQLIRKKLDFFFLTEVEKQESQTDFALVRLGKQVMWEVSHKVSSYQTLVRAPNVFIIQPFMKCYQSLVTKMTCKFAY